MRVWRIEDYAVLYLLYINNFAYEKLPDHNGQSWYRVIGCPVPYNGSIELPGGFVIESHGVELRAARKEQSKR
jgi:hypothetical protein